MSCSNSHVGGWRRLASLPKSPNLESEYWCRGEDNKATEKPRGHENKIGSDSQYFLIFKNNLREFFLAFGSG